VEIGTPVAGTPGLHRLGDLELATRLSYLVWGAGPDDELLDLAGGGGISTPDQIETATVRMLTDPRALARVDRFHSLWLGFEQLPHVIEISSAMRAETEALIRRVIFDDKRPWQDVFRLTETWIDDTLAENYGLPAPGAPAWVDYGTSGRQGLLSQGSFLSYGLKFGDTSPVKRGLMIRARLFCQTIPPPPPGVDTDARPEGGLCKEEVYAAHREGGCASCHSSIDPVGFGLESYDLLGRFRTHEPDNTETPEDESQCAISGEGELAGIGTFSGPGELSQLALDSGLLDKCMVRQIYRFAIGRYHLDDPDEDLVQIVFERLGEGDFRFDELLLEFVRSDAFRHRREPV
jgi:hypothetical protein